MKRILFSTTRPRHWFKSERFLRNYLFLREKFFFGRGRAGFKGHSFFRKMLVLKRFLIWNYSFVHINKFAHLFRRLIGRGQSTVGRLHTFILMLETHLQVALFRAGFASSLLFAKALIQSHAIYCNGTMVSNQSKFLDQGDIVEVLLWMLDPGLSHWHYVLERYSVFKVRLFSRRLKDFVRYLVGMKYGLAVKIKQRQSAVTAAYIGEFLKQ